MAGFADDVAKWAAKAQGRRKAVTLTAAQKVITDAQTPEEKGGRMKVDTGFLRNSGTLSLTGIPSGPERNPDPNTPRPDRLADLSYDFGDGSAARYWFGWTAEYAREREAQDGFLITAVGRWRRYVNEAVAEAKARLP